MRLRIFKKANIKKYRLDFLYIFFLSFLSPLYFYKLGQSSLVSWDEAWYGAIARNILNSGNLLIMSWNGAVYSDHPPAGFWIIALSESIFGMDEFGVRAGSAIFGLAGLLITYLLGRELFSKTAGFASALALSSTYWYISRSRSGNLDIFLTVFFVLTIYLAVKSSKNPRFLLPFAASFGLLVLTKSLIPLTIIPALIIIFLGSKIKIKEIIKPLAAFLLITLPWFVTQYIYDPPVFYKYFKTGTPGVGQKTDYMENFNQIKEYLHFGVGKWFWPGVLGVLAGPLTLNKALIALSVFCLSFFAPFVLSEKGQLWHLIPLYPFMILSFFGFIQVSSDIVSKKLLKNFSKQITMLTVAVMIVFSGYLSWMQIKRSWYEFIDIPRYISDEAILSKKAAEYPYKFYIDGSDFTPAAYFYSDKKVGKIWDEGLKPLFESGEKFVLITHQWRLDKFNIKPGEYKLIATDRDKILVVRE
jgi:4-amino-4-deoxy-L-arabinose transferase-like glycosyltransferase